MGNPKEKGSFITKTNYLIANIAKYLIFPLIFVIILDVFFRYVFNKPNIYSYDLTWMFFAALAFLGGAYGLHDGLHVKADVVYNLLKPKTQRVLDIVSYIIFFFLSMTAMLYATFKLMMKSWLLHETSVYTTWQPILGPIKTILFISFVLLTLQGIVQFVNICRKS